MNFLFVNIAYAKSENLDQFILNVDRLIINPLIILLFSLALMFFFFGVFEFISNQENEENKTKGKKHMLWGIIGITIMMGVWSILGIILNTFNINGIDLKEDTVHLNDYNPQYPFTGK